MNLNELHIPHADTAAMWAAEREYTLRMTRYQALRIFAIGGTSLIGRAR